jgi:hypothetical protein
LQKFTAGHTFAKIMTAGLDPLGKRKEYDTSVHMLTDLLSQKIYGKRKYRGVWYDRLALIFHKHVKALPQVNCFFKYFVSLIIPCTFLTKLTLLSISIFISTYKIF